MLTIRLHLKYIMAFFRSKKIINKNILNKSMFLTIYLFLKRIYKKF